jgi:ParB family chromosome partitioning protein
MRHDRHYVDELAQRMGEGIGRMVRVTNIVSNQDQPRTSLGDFSDLVKSIEKHGILEPLLVRKGQQGKYELVSGERRFHAAMEAELTEVPCIELEVSDQHALEIALIENLQRQDLSAFEEAEGFRTLIKKYDYTHEEVGEAVGRSRVTVTEVLRLLTIPADIRAECRHADIHAKGILLEIAKAGSPDAMRLLIQAIVEERLDRQELRERRAQLADGHAGDQGAEHSEEDDGHRSTKRPRPFVWKYQPKDRPFSVSLAFTTDKEPEPEEVIAALEDLLEELRSSAKG